MPINVPNGTSHVKDNTVPKDILQIVPVGTLNEDMAHDFKSALIWHMENHATKISDLVQRSGVSRDVVNKILTRENASTSVDNALLIAAYYGKSVEQFLNCTPVDDAAKIKNLLELLGEADLKFLASHAQFLVQERAKK